METEFRIGDKLEIEERQAANGQTETVIRGTIMRYGDIGLVGNMYRERFTERSLRPRENFAIEVNVMHQRDRLLGTAPGNATVEFRDKDVTVEMVAPDTTEGRDAVGLIRAGVLKGWSIEFTNPKERRIDRIREVYEAELVGVAIVSNPVYNATNISVAHRMQRLDEEEARPVPPKPRMVL